jgi:hypothetical protein
VRWASAWIAKNASSHAADKTGYALTSKDTELEVLQSLGAAPLMSGEIIFIGQQLTCMHAWCPRSLVNRIKCRICDTALNFAYLGSVSIKIKPPKVRCVVYKGGAFP